MFHDEIRERIEERFRRMGRRMVEVNARQAYVIAGAEWLPNENGTAPAQWIETAGRVVLLLPGPPGELKALFEQECLPRLLRLAPPRVIRTRRFRFLGGRDRVRAMAAQTALDMLRKAVG